MSELLVGPLRLGRRTPAGGGAPSQSIVCVLPMTDGFGAEVTRSAERAVRELSRAYRVLPPTVIADLCDVDAINPGGMHALLAIRGVCRDAGLELRLVALAPLRTVLEDAGAGWRGSVFPSVRHALPGGGVTDTIVAALGERLRDREQQLASLPAIEQAKGMLMQDFGLDPDEAFEVLKRLSQQGNVKVRDVAARLTGRLRGRASEPATMAAPQVVQALHDQLLAD
ncbi:ANTAR domain-containing protein [Catenuloplanes sp. NPDC051500]|uniref:ANTAR domain-containing protein n=1 Tax=Catenuloplanes sp. NPDC051500 TaxID=3363959 RepID=UPI0037A1E36B